MNISIVKRFSISAGLLLVGMAMIQLLGNRGEIVVQPADPVSGFSTRYLFWTLGALEFLVAAICLFTRQMSFQMGSVVWLSSILFLYRLALLYYGVKSLGAYYDTMAWNFGISTMAMNCLLASATAYLWLGSALALFLLNREARQNAEAVAPPNAEIVRT